MIHLKRLRGEDFVVNAEMIETIEETPDTIITLTTGRKLVVQDRMSDVVKKVVEYKREILRGTAQ